MHKKYLVDVDVADAIGVAEHRDLGVGLDVADLHGRLRRGSETSLLLCTRSHNTWMIRDE